MGTTGVEATDFVFRVSLNRYQRDNLLSLVEAIIGAPGGHPLSQLNTGDWIGELHDQLAPEMGPGTPNRTKDELLICEDSTAPDAELGAGADVEPAPAMPGIS